MLKQGRFLDFATNLKYLANLEKFAAKPPLDVFHNLSSIERDLKAILHVEQQSISNNNNHHQMDLATILIKGHGIPCINRFSLGPSIVFWAHPAHLLSPTALNLDQLMSLPSSHRAFISVQESDESNAFLSVSTNQFLVRSNPTSSPTTTTLSGFIESVGLNDITLRWICFPQKISSESSTSSPTTTTAVFEKMSFVLRLDPPVKASILLVENLNRIVKMKTNHGNSLCGQTRGV